ncbi:hypothetical protein [Eisenibacter elegans]|uniref:hypothetical protein n=1 Tax=Eisenibacter elegans TaxID=997 RepID=UPI0012B667F8|nr:hypothetical protein [Eisenibacter elegans]
MAFPNNLVILGMLVNTYYQHLLTFPPTKLYTFYIAYFPNTKPQAALYEVI